MTRTRTPPNTLFTTLTCVVLAACSAPPGPSARPEAVATEEPTPSEGPSRTRIEAEVQAEVQANVATPSPPAAPIDIGWNTVPPTNPDPMTELRAQVDAGDFEGAASILNAELAHDLPRYRRAFDSDEELAALRSSDAAAAIRARITAVDAAYRGALQEAVPAVVFREARPMLVRGGLYLPSTRRFLPVGSRMRQTVAALVVPDIERVVVLIQRGTGSYSGAPNIGATMYALFGEGGSLAGVRPGESNELAVAAFPDRMLLRTSFEGIGRSRWSVIAEGSQRSELPSSEVIERAHFFLRNGVALWRDPFYYPDPRVDIDGERRGGALAGWRVHGNQLQRAEGAAVRLSRGHGAHGRHNLVPSADTSVVFVVSNRTYPSCSHVIDRVNAAAGTSTRFAAGAGVAAALFHADGSLFVQRNTTTHRYGPGANEDADGGEALPEGVALINPLQCERRP